MSFAHCSISWRPISVEPVRRACAPAGCWSFAADRAGGAGDHVEYSGGDPGAIRQFGQRQRGKRRLAGRFQDHGAAGGQRRARFAGDHRRREVPRRDGGGNADGLLITSRRLSVARNGVAVDALTFFGEPLNKGGGVADFAFGFRQRFSCSRSSGERDRPGSPS